MAPTVEIPAAYNGPLRSGNGGYSAGALAGFVEGPTAVSLRRPVPLATPLEVEVDADGGARALHAGELVAEAHPLPELTIEVPEPVGVEEARAASEGYRGAAEGEFSRCFVCGLGREDSFGVFAGPVAGRELVASPWTPEPGLAGPDGSLPEPLVWAVLDCPTFFASYLRSEPRPAVLARMAARVLAPVAAGVEHVVVAWPLGVDGRKRRAGSALLDADGRVLAAAEVLMIELRSG